MDEEALAEIEKRLEDGPEEPWTICSSPEEDSRGRPTGRSEFFVRFGGPPGELSEDTTLIRDWATAALIASAPSDLRRLLAEVRLLRSLARDCDRYAAGEEAGRLAALRFMVRSKEPAGRWWWTKKYRDGNADDLPSTLFDLLEGGTLENGGLMRFYGEEEGRAGAMADLAEALVRLARKGFPEEEKHG